MLNFPLLLLVPRVIHHSPSRRGGKTCSKSSASWGLCLEECDIHAGSFSPVSQGFISGYFYMFSYHYLLPSPRLPAGARQRSPAAPWFCTMVCQAVTEVGLGSPLPRGHSQNWSCSREGSSHWAQEQGLKQTRQILSPCTVRSAQRSAWRYSYYEICFLVFL